nr:SEC14-like protein 4 [Parasteatoda tepidariorum]
MSRHVFFSPDGWKEKLLENIDDEVLPAFLGGKRTDPDGNPLCRSLICPGGKIPERYFLSSNKSTIRNLEGVKRLVVSRHSSTDVVIDVLHPSSVLMWEFETKDRDIGFGINCKIPDQNDGEIIELIPKKRIDTSNGPETGTYVCHNAGSHILLFDNSYSWLHSKEIYYKTKVIPPTNAD